jgi:4-nitrophenyl phosphatase
MATAIPDLGRYDAVLIDLDGTFYREDEGGVRVLPGAPELVRRLERDGRKYACLTNSGSSPRQLSRKLAEMGARVDEGHVWSCAAAAAEYVRHRWGKGARVFNLATDGIDELLAGRVRWVEAAEEACDVVLAAAPVNRWATAQRQWTALQLLRRGGAALVGLCADRVYPSHRGAEFGAGSMTMMLAYAADVAPVFCGKPEEVFFRELCDRLGVAPDRCLLLGDNLESDVGGARRVGMASALVLTGVASRADAEKAPADRRPDYVLGSLTELA